MAHGPAKDALRRSAYIDLQRNPPLRQLSTPVGCVSLGRCVPKGGHILGYLVAQAMVFGRVIGLGDLTDIDPHNIRLRLHQPAHFGDPRLNLCS